MNGGVASFNTDTPLQVFHHKSKRHRRSTHRNHTYSDIYFLVEPDPFAVIHLNVHPGDRTGQSCGEPNQTSKFMLHLF